MENPENWEEKALVFAPNSLSLRCSPVMGDLGSWSRGDANFPLVTRAHF